MDKKNLTVDEAINLINNEGDIHTFRQSGFGIIGCDHRRENIIEKFNQFSKTLQLSGKQARSLNHGLVLTDDTGYLFIETDENKLNEFDPIDL